MSWTPAGRMLADEIQRNGPIPFSRFMQVALYEPEIGYYRRDPFGKDGDFYTAEQVQPVFGRLMASFIGDLTKTLHPGAQVVELGAGRRETASALAAFSYTAVDIGYGEMPENFTGVVFSNELFDALPVDVLEHHDDQVWERRVGIDGDRFVWKLGSSVQDRWEAGVRLRETQQHRIEMLQRINQHLERGYVLTIDYGYTARELARFPEGTLMSFRRHQASEDVLADPGERDITAHVDFTALQQHGEKIGLETVRFETLAQMILRVGESDEFATPLMAETASEASKLRLQLKTLLFGMGETFRVLLQRKG